MITRFYVDNYKCLVNFEYKPQPMELIIGANGSGKSTVFEALDKVRRFMDEKVNVEEIFSLQTRTKWVKESSSSQTFELDFNHGEEHFRYRLQIAREYEDFYVEHEVLTRNGHPYFESFWKGVEGLDDKDISLKFHQKYPKQLRWMRYHLAGLEVPLNNPTQSILSVLPLHAQLENLLFLRLNPPLIGSQFGKVESRLNLNGSNFASYYLYVLQQKQGAMFEVISHLRDVLPGFDSFAVDEDFERGKRRLMVNFKNLDGAKTKGAAPLKFSFDDLSDGQRALIVLYTLLFCALDAEATLVIDEPENYIALRELQPLIMLMEERIEEVGGQILLISHNQEFINMLTDRGKCVRFYRENNGHTRIAAFNPDSPLESAEIVARGWEDDEQ